MKYLTVLLAIIGILLGVSCDKEIAYPVAPIYFPGSQEFGWSTAMKNGLAFESSGIASRSSLSSEFFWGIKFLTFSDWGAKRESISIGELSFELGTRQILDEDSNQENGIPVGFYSTLSDDGDVLEDIYKIDTRQDSWIEIVSIDTINGEVSMAGKYALYFKIDDEKVNPSNPDHVRFTDGVFEVKFEQ